MTEGATAALDETQIGQFDVTLFAAETARMPVLVHRFDHPTDDEFAAFTAARREQHLEVVLAVLASLELEESAVFEDLETLCTPIILLIFNYLFFFFGIEFNLQSFPPCNGIIDCVI